MKKLKMEIKVPEAVFSNILVTAFDGRYGGSWFWAAPHRIDEDDDAISVKEIGGEEYWYEARIYDKEADHEKDRTYWVVTWDVLLHGMQLLVDRGNLPQDQRSLWASTTKEIIEEAVATNDTAQIDSALADTIVQFGLFGEEIYG